MKKTIIMLAVAFFTGTAVMAQVDSTTTTTTTTKTTRYMYYPETNVYYNETTRTYSYFDPATNTWMTNAQLPTTIVINKNDKAELTYSGADVWKDNAMHQKKYKKAMKKMEKAEDKVNKN